MRYDLRMTEKKKSTALDRLVDAAELIEGATAIERDQLGFAARSLAVASLPHKAVKPNMQYQRRNGDLLVSLYSAGPLPYGALARLVLIFLASSAVKRQDREIQLGKSMASFMRQLGIESHGGKNNYIDRLQLQTGRILRSGLLIEQANVSSKGIATTLLNMTFVDKASLWWSKNEAQNSLFESSVLLNEQFYLSCIKNPIPIDMAAIQALKNSSLAIDLYIFLTHRASYLRASTLITWTELTEQFGGSFERVYDFKVAFKKALARVWVVYRHASFDITNDGLLLKPMLTHVGKRLT